MDFAHSAKALDLCQRMETFVQQYLLPYNAAWHRSVQEGVYPPPFLEDLKALAQDEGSTHPLLLGLLLSWRLRFRIGLLAVFCHWASRFMLCTVSVKALAMGVPRFSKTPANVS